ncbi:hypothetical protein Hanom_Chr07g00593801 [Helianthus anomalus]
MYFRVNLMLTNMNPNFQLGFENRQPLTQERYRTFGVPYTNAQMDLYDDFPITRYYNVFFPPSI